jgi:hypothetical protein
MKFLEEISKRSLVDMIIDKRIEERLTDGMPRCPYDINGNGCPKYRQDDEGDYCVHTLIDFGRSYCEVGVKEDRCV